MNKAGISTAFAAGMLTIGLALPAAGAPVTGAAAGLAALADTGLTPVQSRRARSRAPRPAAPSGFRDNVGSVVYDGQGYGYNRLTGQRYNSCVFDEGYGRTRPCDAGGGG